MPALGRVEWWSSAEESKEGLRHSAAKGSPTAKGAFFRRKVMFYGTMMAGRKDAGNERRREKPVPSQIGLAVNEMEAWLPYSAE